jgi:hypothetical protein
MSRALMRMAFYFDAAAFGGNYAIGSYELFFGCLRRYEGRSPHLLVAVGDLSGNSLSNDSGTPVEDIYRRMIYGHPVWADVEIDDLLVRNVFVMAVDGCSLDLRDWLHACLRDHGSYLGASQAIDSEPIHWALLREGLAAYFRVVDGGVRMFFNSASLNSDEDRDEAVAGEIARFGFGAVQWEDNYGEGLIFGADTFGYWRRRAQLQPFAEHRLEALADDVLMRLNAINPDLSEELHAALEALSRAERPPQFAQALLSCRRVLEQLADDLYPAKKSSSGVRLDKQSYLNRLTQFVVEALPEDLESQRLIEDLHRRMRTWVDSCSAGIHAGAGGKQSQRLAGELLEILRDLVSLKPPPLETWLTQHTREVKERVNREWP